MPFYLHRPRQAHTNSEELSWPMAAAPRRRRTGAGPIARYGGGGRVYIDGLTAADGLPAAISPIDDDNCRSTQPLDNRREAGESADALGKREGCPVARHPTSTAARQRGAPAQQRAPRQRLCTNAVATRRGTTQASRPTAWGTRREGPAATRAGGCHPHGRAPMRVDVAKSPTQTAPPPSAWNLSRAGGGG